jgi:hypothetical protein
VNDARDQITDAVEMLCQCGGAQIFLPLSCQSPLCLSGWTDAPPRATLTISQSTTGSTTGSAWLSSLARRATRIKLDHARIASPPLHRQLELNGIAPRTPRPRTPPPLAAFAPARAKGKRGSATPTSQLFPSRNG